MLNNKFDPLHAIAARFNESTELNLCECTVRRYIRKLKMDCSKGVQKPFVSSKNIAAGILWARTHDGWTLAQWSNVMFTDESRFTVRSVRNRLRIWRTRGIHLHPKSVVPTFESGYQSVSVWGGFSARGRTPLVGTMGTFNQHTYNAIIDPHIIPFTE